MAHGDAREGKWRGNWRMEWVARTILTTPEHGVSSITTADAHTSAVKSQLNWRPHRFKWTRPFCRKTKFGFCACTITFQLASTTGSVAISLMFRLLLSQENSLDTFYLSEYKCAERIRVDSQQSCRLLLPRTSRPAAGTVRPPIQWLPGTLFLVSKTDEAWGWPLISV